MPNRRQTIIGSAAVAMAGLVPTRTIAQTPAAVEDSRTISHARGTIDIPASPSNVLALGEDWLLADLIELGVPPAASSGTFSEWLGIPEELTAGVAHSPRFFELDLEAVIAMAPDLILVPDEYYEFTPDVFANLEEIAPVIYYPKTADWQVDFTFLASIYGLEAEAATIIAQLLTEIDESATALNVAGRTVSYATIYPDSTNIAIWLSGENAIVDVAIALGMVVEPSAEDFEIDHNGRVDISYEQANVLTGETLLLLQVTGGMSPGEDEKLAEVMEMQLWQNIPAVQNDRAFVIERTSYPGFILGRRNLLARYTEIFGQA